MGNGVNVVRGKSVEVVHLLSCLQLSICGILGYELFNYLYIYTLYEL